MNMLSNRNLAVTRGSTTVNGSVNNGCPQGGGGSIPYFVGEGRSTESALHGAVSLIEEQIEGGGYAVGAFLDTEGASNNTTTDSICKAAKDKGIPDPLIKWIMNMLSNRKLTVTRGYNGCPQGVVLSPTLWGMVIDGALRMLTNLGVAAVGYADDILIFIRGKHLKLKIQIKEQAKYLGVILDKKLYWKTQIDQQCRKFASAFWMCRRAIGQGWGLNYKTVLWIYNCILIPRLTYAATAWWKRTDLKTVQKKLETLRGWILRAATGAMKTTPTAALGAITEVEPFHRTIQAAAFIAAHRLKNYGLWREKGEHTKEQIKGKDYTVLSMRLDKTIHRNNFEK
ncbi:hypothetical protein TSAR_006302 [Trichomalopsis sarcophagae]|uniref:Reverse transcriptase domain-containing protein n=1 Tax=Trichomalopsis sarcophagae TaxID=543379 RepID=A0A232EKJ0_9HYME|nr:hypothetical protein TSAR_006302 [Trichomalopsis sarcophagae]